MYTAHVHFFTNLDLFCIDNAHVIYRKIRYIHFSRCVIFGILDDGQVQKPGNHKHDVIMFHVLVFAGPLLDGSILVCGPSQLETYFYVCGPSVLCVLAA